MGIDFSAPTSGGGIVRQCMIGSVHAGSLQSTQSWAALNTREAPALVTAAARLLAEDAERERRRKRSASPVASTASTAAPIPDPSWKLSQREYNAVLACSAAAVERKSAQDVYRMCCMEAEAARSAYAEASADLQSQELHVEWCERRAAELAWPRSPAKCRRKGREFDPDGAKLQRERLLVTARRGRSGLAKTGLEVRDLLISDDVAQLGAWQAQQGLLIADKAFQDHLKRLSKSTRRRAVHAGLLLARDCEV